MRSHPPRSQRKWLAGALGAVFVAAMLSLTPPGRAIAEDVGQLVGIGEPSSFDQSAISDLPASGPGLVLASGTIPGSEQPYELVGYASEETSQGGSPGPMSCLNFDLPGLDKPSEAGFNRVCVGGPQRRTLDTSGFTDAEDTLGPDARYWVEGLVSPEVSRVEVTYEDADGERQQAPVVLGMLTDEIADQVGAPVELGRFLGFMPDDGIASSAVGASPDEHPFLETIEVRAFDADGNEIATQPFGLALTDQISDDGSVSDTRRPARPRPSVPPPSTSPEVRQSLEEAARMEAYFDYLWQSTIEKAQAGTLNAEVDPAEVERILGFALRPSTETATEDEVIELTEQLRAAGDLPPLSAESPPPGWNP